MAMLGCTGGCLPAGSNCGADFVSRRRRIGIAATGGVTDPHRHVDPDSLEGAWQVFLARRAHRDSERAGRRDSQGKYGLARSDYIQAVLTPSRQTLFSRTILQDSVYGTLAKHSEVFSRSSTLKLATCTVVLLFLFYSFTTVRLLFLFLHVYKRPKSFFHVVQSNSTTAPGTSKVDVAKETKGAPASNPMTRS